MNYTARGGTDEIHAEIERRTAYNLIFTIQSMMDQAVCGVGRETCSGCRRSSLLSDPSTVSLMPEAVITVNLVTYKRYIKKRW